MKFMYFLFNKISLRLSFFLKIDVTILIDEIYFRFPVPETSVQAALMVAADVISPGPRRDRTCLRGFRPGRTKFSLLSYRD